MPTLDVVVSCPVNRTFKVEQVAGMFDVPLEEKVREEFSVELPGPRENWEIGCIVGPSGSGKSTIARAAFSKNLFTAGEWPADKSVLDGFGDLSIKQITQVLTAVGFSSPPSWVKPYGVLSNGERFRCDLARALLCGPELVVYDEFTSVVDRTVAKIGSAAVAKAIRKKRVKRRFVAVTCHYDVVEWLQPDWVLDMASRRLARGRLQRPQIQIEVAPIHRSAWVLFRRHHYLSGSLNVSAHCFAAFWGDVPVGFSAWMALGGGNPGSKGRSLMQREHRTVVLPDYQGLGIGTRLSDFCASIFTGAGYRAYSTTGHPAMIQYRWRSPNWRKYRLGMTACRPEQENIYRAANSAAGRLTGGFKYVGPAMAAARAREFLRKDAQVFVKRDSVQAVEAAVKRYPGATAALIGRLTGTTTSSVRNALEELVAAGDVVRAGRGGGRDPLAFYPAAGPESRKTPQPAQDCATATPTGR